jgi:hypothetical protein
MKAGAQAYITKPASADDLLEKVKYLLGRKGMISFEKDSTALPVLVTDASVAAALVDRERRYKAVSVSYAAAGGYLATELVGKHAADIFPDVSGEAGRILDLVHQTRQPQFISRYPYQTPEHGITYWDAAMWPIESAEADTDVLIVIRQKEQSGDIVIA